MSHPVEKPVLVYTRIDENRRATTLLVASFVLLIIPAALFLSHYLWSGFLFIGVLLSLVNPAANLDWVYINIMGTIVIGIAFTLLITWLEFLAAETVALKIASARPLQQNEGRELWRTVENLCIGTGLPQPVLYLVESASPNAFTVGLAPDRAKLVVTRGLLELLDRRELEGVVAHELSHIGNHDTRLYTITAALEALLRIPLQIIIELFRFLIRSPVGMIFAAFLAFQIVTLLFLAIETAFEDIALFDDKISTEMRWQMCLLMFISFFLNAYAFLVGPLFGWLVRMAITRRREFLADADAFLLTLNPDALARALVKIYGARDLKMKVHPAMARMYIVDPRTTRFSTHPSVEERVAELARMGSGFPQKMLEEAKTSDQEIETTRPPSVSIPSPKPEPTPVQNKSNVISSAIYGITAGSLTMAVLSILMALLMVMVGGEFSPDSWWKLLIPFVPGCVGAGVAAHKSGTYGAKVVVFAIIFGFISMLLANLASTLFYIIFKTDSAVLDYQIGATLRTLMEIVIGALLGARFGRKEVGILRN